jgi:hypothetical protein
MLAERERAVEASMADCKACGGLLEEDEGMRHHTPGGREGSTTYYYFDCSECGRQWTRIVDSCGMGGHGSFWHEGHKPAD